MGLENVFLSYTPEDSHGTHVLSNGNLTDVMASPNDGIRTNYSRKTGKWYWEVKLDSGGRLVFGIVLDSYLDITSIGNTNASIRAYDSLGNKLPENVAYGITSSLSDIIGVALDLDNGTLTFYKNGVSMGVSHTDIKQFTTQNTVGIRPYFKTGVGNNTMTVNFGQTPFAYPLPNGFQAYAFNTFSRCLVYSNAEYKKYSASTWQTITTSIPTEADYLNGNTLAEVSAIPESAWQQLSGTVELCYYTDDSSVTEAQFNIQTNPFTLADEFAGQSSINIIEYTDNPTQTESTVTLETEPFTFYDEMGDSFDVLYYTDDPAKTSAELEINANYTPLDEIEDDFEVVTWSNAPVEELSNSLATVAKPDVIEGGSLHGTQVDLTKGLGIKKIK